MEFSVKKSINEILSDPLDPEFLDDPYPHLKVARAECPIQHIPKYDMWLLTRYDDVRAVLKDAESFSSGNAHKPLFPLSDEVIKLLGEMGYKAGQPITGSDGEQHKRLRAKASQALALTPANLKLLERQVGAIAEKMVGELPEDGVFDIIEALTARFPAYVVYRFIGFPPEMDEQLLDWCMGRLRLVWSVSSNEEQLGMAKKLADYWKYCEAFMQEQLKAPSDGLAGNLIRLHLEDPQTLSLNEATTIVFGLVFAGQETTSNALGQTLRTLLEDPDRWRNLVRNPSMIDDVFNEVLRLTPPVAAWRRLSTRPSVFGDTEIPAGANLLVHLGSAGNDECKFAHADEFRPDLPGRGTHLAFGHGAHFCLGAPLAKVEARCLLQALIRQTPDLEMLKDQKIEVESTISFRGPKKLLVRRTGNRGSLSA